MDTTRIFIIFFFFPILVQTKSMSMSQENHSAPFDLHNSSTIELPVTSLYQLPDIHMSDYELQQIIFTSNTLFTQMPRDIKIIIYSLIQNYNEAARKAHGEEEDHLTFMLDSTNPFIRNGSHLASYLNSQPDSNIVNKLRKPYHQPLLTKLISEHNNTGVELLLKYADPFLSRSNSETPLFVAAYHGNAEAIKLLLKKGASIIETNKSGWTPLHAAVFNGHLNAVKLLLKDQIGIDQVTLLGITALHFAVYLKETAIIKELLAAGAQPTIKDGFGLTPLEHATYKNQEEIVSIFSQYSPIKDHTR